MGSAPNVGGGFFFFLFFFYSVSETYIQDSYSVQSSACASPVFRNVGLTNNIEIVLSSTVLILVHINLKKYKGLRLE